MVSLKRRGQADTRVVSCSSQGDSEAARDAKLDLRRQPRSLSCGWGTDCRWRRCVLLNLQAGCEAQNAAGGYVSCTTTGTALVTAAGAVGPDSYIDFSHDGAGNCNSIYVANGSSNAVKQP